MKRLRFTVCALLAMVLHVGYLQAQIGDRASPYANNPVEESEDIIFTFYKKCYILNEVWGILNAYLGTRIDSYPCNDEKSDFYDLELKFLLKSASLREAEFELASKHQELEKLENIIEDLYITKEPKDLYEKYTKMFVGDYPANLEFAKIFRAKADVMEEIYKELFGREIKVCFELDRFSHLIEMAKARDGFNDEEIIEYLREPLMIIYKAEVESYNRFIAENRDVLEKLKLLGQNGFKDEHGSIKQLQDILLYLSGLKQNSTAEMLHDAL